MKNRNLSQLTVREGLHIARIADSTINWQLVTPKESWDGFDFIDLSDTEHDNEDFCKFVFQIDYRKDIPKNLCRFRFYEDCQEYFISSEILSNINVYLKSINVII